MKRYTIFLILIPIVIVLLACVYFFGGSANNHKEYNEAASILSEHLEHEGVWPALGQMDFPAKIDEYSYNGIKISELMKAVMFYDGSNGGGCIANCKACSYTNDYQRDNNREYAVYSQDFSIHAPIDGLVIPCGITFDDTLTDVLAKLGVHITNPNALLEKCTGGKTALYKCDRFAFTLHYAEQFLAATPAYVYELHYSETYVTTRPDGRKTNVTRKLIFTFEGESHQLTRYTMSIREKYKLD